MLRRRFFFLVILASLLLGMLGPAQVLAAQEVQAPKVGPQATTVTPDSTPTYATGAANATSVTVSHTTGTGADRLMMVGVSWNCNTTSRTISSVIFSYGSGPTVHNLTQKIVQETGGTTTKRFAAIWYLVDPPSGQTGTVTVTFSGTVSNGIVTGVATFAGVDQTNPFGTALGANSASSGATQSVTLNSLTGNELVFDTLFIGAQTPPDPTVDPSQTKLWSAAVSNTRGAASTKDAASNTSVTMSWTTAGTVVWAIVAVAINPAATAVGDPPVVDDIPDQAILEGGTFTPINLDGYVSDTEDEDAEMTWGILGDTNLSVSIDAARVATISVLDPDWFGSETITFRATDLDGNHDEDGATFTVTNVNDAPVAADDNVTTGVEVPVTIAVLGNDTDVDGNTLTVASVSDPPHGTAAVQGDNTIRYTPDAVYVGSDSFTYDISDGNGGISSATVFVTVSEYMYRVNAGGDAQDMDPDPDFLALHYANLAAIPGLTVSGVSNEASTTNVISTDNVAPYLTQAILQTLLHTVTGTTGDQTMTFDFAVPNGDYLVLLHWAEHNATIDQPGERLFDVSIEDLLQLDDYDIFVRAGGQNKAVTETILTSVTDGELNLAITRQVSVAIIRGIEIVRVIDTTPPALDITGASADGEPMAGDLATGYILQTTNDHGLDHLIQFAAGTSANESLAGEYFGLYLTESDVTADYLKAYYAWKGVPEPYLSYLQGAADGTNPFVYIEGSTVTLVDAAQHSIQGVDSAMTVPDNFPLGTYTVEGVIRDLAGNETTVTLILVVAGNRTPERPAKPLVSIARIVDVSADDIELSWPAVNTDAGGNFTMVTTYQVFRSTVAYFTPDSTPGTGNLVMETTDLDYLHENAVAGGAYYFYIVQAVNEVDPSDDSNRVGVFGFQLLPGDAP